MEAAAWPSAQEGLLSLSGGESQPATLHQVCRGQVPHSTPPLLLSYAPSLLRSFAPSLLSSFAPSLSTPPPLHSSTPPLFHSSTLPLMLLLFQFLLVVL